MLLFQGFILLLQLHKGSTKFAVLLVRRRILSKVKSLKQKTPSNFKKLLGALGATPSGCTKKCPHWKIIKVKSSQQKTPSNFNNLLGALGDTPSGCTKKCPHWKFIKS